MSDFDEEAEREKLREKYERDKERRKSTQRMSELLLKGATMTNRHCDECGDPIFRYDGQEFCPTCQQAGQQTGGGATAEASGTSPKGGGTSAEASGTNPKASRTSAEASRTSAEASRTGAEASDETSRTGAEESDPTEINTEANAGTGSGVAAGAGADGDSEPQPAATGPADTGRDSVGPGTPIEPADGAPAGRTPETPAGAAETRAAVGDAGQDSAETDERQGDLTAARASLIRSVERYARAAEQTDDPRRARDHLAAAHEAAETLNALDR